jgi:CDP-paratose 2-epimerase
MNIVVTGSAGFLGNYVTNYFADRGHHIIGLDNLSRKGSKLNAAKQKEDPRVTFKECDISDEYVLGVCLTNEKFDWIIDCAAEPSVLAGFGKGSRDLINNNLISTINLLEICKERKCGFLLMSTSRVYSIEELSKQEKMEMVDTFTPINPRGITENFSTASPISLYGSTKLTSEILAKEYSQMFGFPLWINRCGVIAGAGQFGKIDQGVFSFWIYSWLKRNPVKYIGFGGTGKQVRDVVHPFDICEVMNKQIYCNDIYTDPTYNLGGGIVNSMSLLQLSKWCKENINEDDSIVTSSDEVRPFDIPIFIMDSTKAESRWGFKNTYTMDEILAEIRDYAINNPEFLDYLYS